MCFFPPHTSPWGTGWPTPGSRAWGTRTEETRDSCSYDKNGQTRRFSQHSYTGKGATGAGSWNSANTYMGGSRSCATTCSGGSRICANTYRDRSMNCATCTTYRGGSSYFSNTYRVDPENLFGGLGVHQNIVLTWQIVGVLDCNISCVSFLFISTQKEVRQYHQQGGSRNFFEGGSLHSKYWVGDDF